MVKPVYNLPQDPRDDAAAARHWLDALPERYSPEDHARFARACDLLLRCRGNQDLDTGETQVRHLLCTADILVRLRMDADTLIAALLNGCFRRSGVGEESPAAHFGPGIADMVEDLDRIDQLADVDAVIAAKDRREHEENLRRLLLGIAKDVRVVLVVLAERLHLIRSIADLDAERRREIAEDTRRIYAPLANRLGVWQVKWELEDLAMRYLEPDEYKRIARRLDGRRAERESFVAEAIATLDERFAAADIGADISGRPKHIYSIWRKMRRKHVGIDQIFDLRAVRILVRDVASCYAALGIVHGLWKHIPRESECRRARDAKRDIPVPLSPCARATTCTCRGRPAPGPRLRHFAPPPDPYDEWLDGVSDALASGLRQLRDLRPLRHFGQPLAPTPTADYPPRASRFPGGQRSTTTSLPPRAICTSRCTQS